jgi:hypothetical protein
MPTKYDYKLILAVNADDLAKLTQLGIIVGNPVCHITSCYLETSDVSDLLKAPKLFQMGNGATVKSGSQLQFVTLGFKPGLTGEEIDAKMKAGALSKYINNCQHYSVFAIATEQE